MITGPSDEALKPFDDTQESTMEMDVVMKLNHEESWEEARLRSTTKDNNLIMCSEVATEDYEKKIIAEVARNQEETEFILHFVFNGRERKGSSATWK